MLISRVKRLSPSPRWLDTLFNSISYLSQMWFWTQPMWIQLCWCLWNQYSTSKKFQIPPHHSLPFNYSLGCKCLQCLSSLGKLSRWTRSLLYLLSRSAQLKGSSYCSFSDTDFHSKWRARCRSLPLKIFWFLELMLCNQHNWSRLLLG